MLTVSSDLARIVRLGVLSFDDVRVIDEDPNWVLGYADDRALVYLKKVGENALLRFYVLHVIALPLAAAVLISVHFWRVRKDGGISGPL